ncbi:MAG: hypothetical protein L3J26_13540 [Candidatus Polarisedimenticolaceae bacterium]|nr:hypothetical protein [Candidatus Polarisedimenticolaceae bacterium]
MKHLFLLLLAANLGLFVWGYQREQAAEHAKPHARADVGNLQLLSEQPPPLEPESQQEPKPIQEEPPATEVVAENLIAGMEPDAIAETTEQAESAAEVEMPLSEEEGHEGFQTTQQVQGEPDQKVVQATKTERAEALSMLVEDTAPVDKEGTEQWAKVLQPEDEAEPDQAIEAADESQTEVAVAPEPQPRPLACYRLGPIADSASAEGLSGHLTQLGLATVTHRQSIKKTKGYWVMLPSLASYGQARQKQRELKEAGFSDFWIFPKGEYENAISLGLYSRLSNAETAHKQSLKKGVTTVVVPHQVEVEQYWLTFQSVEQPPLAEESRLALQEAYPDEKFTVQPCPTVVTR